MLVSKYRFFLLSVLIWSILMLGIKIRTILKSELNVLHENVNVFNSRFPRKPRNNKNLGGQSIVRHPVGRGIKSNTAIR